jgi:hypothetical protein
MESHSRQACIVLLLNTKANKHMQAGRLERLADTASSGTKGG